MEFTKKFKLISALVAGVLVASIAACAVMGGVALGVEYTEGAFHAGDLLRDTLLCTFAAAILLFAYLGARYRMAAGIAGAVTLLLSTAVTAAITLALRLPLNPASFSVMLFALGYCAYAQMLLQHRLRENAAADQQADRHMPAIADASVRQLLPHLLAPATAVLLIAVLLYVFIGAPAAAFAIPMGIAALCCACICIFLTPGLWQRLPAPMHESAPRGKSKKR